MSISKATIVSNKNKHYSYLDDIIINVVMCLKRLKNSNEVTVMNEKKFCMK